MKKYIKTTDSVFASSMNRIVSHLPTNNIATITAFITSSDEKRPFTKSRPSYTENLNRNKDMKRFLRNGFTYEPDDDDIQISSYLGSGYHYPFSKVLGYYSETRDSVPSFERTFYVVCPDNVSFETFKNDMLHLTKHFEQQSVLIWSKDEEIAYLYGTDDYKNYSLWKVFNTYSINVIKQSKDIAWTQYNKDKLYFNNSAETLDGSIIISCTEFPKSIKGWGGMGDSIGAAHFREKLHNIYKEDY